MDSIPDVTVVQGDFTDDEGFSRLIEAISDNPADLVISKLTPNMGGVRVPTSRAPCIGASWRDERSAPGGEFLAKIFQGEGFDAYRKPVREMFGKVQVRKPLSSRDRSCEQSLLARGFRGE